MKTKTEREKHNQLKSLERYEVAVKFLTRPYENKLTLAQSIAIQTVLDRVAHEQRKCKDGKLGNIKIVQEMQNKIDLLAKRLTFVTHPDDDKGRQIVQKILSEK